MAPPLLQAAHQNKKLSTAGAFLLVGLLLMVGVGAWSERLAPEHFFGMLAAGFVLAVGAALFAVYAVRCPRCRLAWVRWSLGNQSHGQWLHWLYDFTTWPGCGVSATSQGQLQPNSTLHTDARASAVLDQTPSARAGERGR